MGIPAGEGSELTVNEMSRMDENEIIDFRQEDAELEQQLRAASLGQNTRSPPSGLLSGFMSSIQTSIMGKDALSPDDIQHAISAMQKRLQQRNVSAEVSNKICSSVARTLEGKKLTSFTGVAKTVRMAMAETITRILSPPRSIDVLAKIRASKAQGKPYSIVFVGVNGVGKSTNLAKIAYWLRQQDLNIMIAACDTFRYDLGMHRADMGVRLAFGHTNRQPAPIWIAWHARTSQVVMKDLFMAITSRGRLCGRIIQNFNGFGGMRAGMLIHSTTDHVLGGQMLAPCITASSNQSISSSVLHGMFAGLELLSS